MLPIFIRSAPEFQSVVQFGITPESLVLEFKQAVNDWNPPAGDPQRQERRKEAQKEMCRDIAQFVNTLGGCLLIGVAERFDASRGLKVADTIAPVKDAEQLRQWIEQTIVNYLVPSTFSHDIVAIEPPEGIVLAINIPASRHLVWLWDSDDHTTECLRRTSHGKEWMNPDEMERHIMDGSRAAKLALITAKEHAQSNRVNIAGGLWREDELINRNREQQRWNPPSPITFGQIGEYWFELKVPNKNGLCPVTIPYGLVEEAWVGVFGAVTLLLGVRVIMLERDNLVTLEPYEKE